MFFERITGPMRVESTSSGGVRTYRLKPKGGGRMVKGELYAIKALATSGDNARVALELFHGPEEGLTGLHSTPIATADPGSTFPAVVQGQSDLSKMLNEYTGAVIKASSTDANPQWLEIEVYRMRKAF
jgi:hypothetical protein